MIFLFPRWDILVSWRVRTCFVRFLESQLERLHWISGWFQAGWVKPQRWPRVSLEPSWWVARRGMQKDIWWTLHFIVLQRWYGCIDNSNWAMHNLSQNNTLKHFTTIPTSTTKRYYMGFVHDASVRLCHPFSITIPTPSDYPWSLMGPSSFLPSVCSCNKSATSPNIEKRITGTPPKLTPGKHRPNGCLALVLIVRLPSKEHMAWSARKT